MVDQKVYYWTEDGKKQGEPPAGGTFDTRIDDVLATYTIDALAEYEEKVVKEYPNGGKDVELVEVKPQRSHWTYTLDGKDITADYDGDKPDADYVDGRSLKFTWHRQIWRPLTDEEIKEREEAGLKQKTTPTVQELSNAVMELAEIIAGKE